jgi:[protein-PII] uridylyltransferase
MLSRPRPARIADVVDGVRLRAQLTAAALDCIGDETGTRARALHLLHTALFRGRMIAKERLESGAGGQETAQLISAVADEVVSALFDFTTTHVFRARNPTEGERMAILAVGGYGRGELAPSSDWDLLFLRAYKPTPWAESVIEYMLYLLWDMGVKIGHASRSIDECLKLAREDHTVQTALLEARPLTGDRGLGAEFVQRFQTEIVSSDPRKFIAQKLAERDQRHARTGSSRYLVEPNVKESKGGLRDLHTLGWILRRRYGGDGEAATYVDQGIFSAEEATIFRRAADFFWAVRSHLHFLLGRAEERLTFDVQPELAQRLGFAENRRQPAVERFMKRYFLHARDVGMLTRVLAAKLESEQAKRSPLTLSRLVPPRRNDNLPTGFRLTDGRIALESEATLDSDPVNLLRLFEYADARNLDIHPDALHAVARRLKRITGPVRIDPAARASFLSLVASPHDPGAALRLMHETGVLGRFLPEFGRVVAQMQFNMYHHYTVDEHTLRAIDVIAGIEKGVFGDEHPLATTILPKIANRRALYLAMLLHDTGKGRGDQEVQGARSARLACRRLGLPEEEVELVAWLVGHHLLMSDVAQKRDLGDPATIARFAAAVGSIERLRLLLVLTVADIRAVGPGVWNGWKGQLLRDLYRLTEAAFHGGRTDEAGVRERLAEQAWAVRAEVTAGVASTPAFAAWIEALDDAYWLSFDRAAVTWHLAIAAQGFVQTGRLEGVRVAARPMPKTGVTELLVHAPDRPGLFAAIAAVLASAGADVSDARIHTTKDGMAFDVFSILDSQGGPFGADHVDAIGPLVARVQAVAEGRAPAELRRQTVPRRAAAFSIEPWVVFDNALTPSASVIEASGRDRPGLLADLAGILAEAGLSIVSAHIDAYGERASDVFYVVDGDGGQISDPARIAALRVRLAAALRDNEPDAPSDPARNKLAVAPASKAR